MTPNDINVLLHYHVSPTVHPRISAPAVQDSIQWFVSRNILTSTGENLYTTTDRGKALVNVLCNIKAPEQAWIDEQGNVIQI